VTDPVDRALIAALSTDWSLHGSTDGSLQRSTDGSLQESTSGSPPSDVDAGLTAQDLADQVGLPLAVVEAVAREGLLHPVPNADPPRYTRDDVTVLRAGTILLEAGLPLGELLDLARRADQALRELADHAVEVFLHFVRDPARARTDDPDGAADEVVAAFRGMLPAASDLVGAHFGRLLVTAARARVEAEAVDGAQGAT
jgi:hypothetical protein